MVRIIFPAVLPSPVQYKARDQKWGNGGCRRTTHPWMCSQNSNSAHLRDLRVGTDEACQDAVKAVDPTIEISLVSGRPTLGPLLIVSLLYVLRHYEEETEYLLVGLISRDE